jgi:hypothetical protein
MSRPKITYRRTAGEEYHSCCTGAAGHLADRPRLEAQDWGTAQPDGRRTSAPPSPAAADRPGPTDAVDDCSADTPARSPDATSPSATSPSGPIYPGRGDRRRCNSRPGQGTSDGTGSSDAIGTASAATPSRTCFRTLSKQADERPRWNSHRGLTRTSSRFATIDWQALRLSARSTPSVDGHLSASLLAGDTSRRRGDTKDRWCSPYRPSACQRRAAAQSPQPTLNSFRLEPRRKSETLRPLSEACRCVGVRSIHETLPARILHPYHLEREIV